MVKKGAPMLHEVECLETVGHRHVDTAGQQQLADVEAGPALAQVALDAGLAVQAGGDRLVEAAMLGLGAPVGAEAHLVERLRARRAIERRQQRPGQRKARRGSQRAASVESKGGGDGAHGSAGRLY